MNVIRSQAVGFLNSRCDHIRFGLKIAIMQGVGKIPVIGLIISKSESRAGDLVMHVVLQSIHRIIMA